MNANDSLERGIADVYEHEAPMRAPDWVLASALDTIEVTPQRRVLIRAPWRYTQMNTFAKVAIAAVVVLAIGAVGLSVLGPRGSSGVGGQPSASPSPSLSPAPSSPSPSTDQSAPPPLSSTFTSTMHGFSIAYPTGWVTDPATEPMKAPGLSFPSPDMDWIYDGEYQADLFLALGSQPVGVTAPDAWIADFLNSFDDGCSGHRVPISVDGTNGIICGGNLFASTAGGRGYFVRIYTGSDLPPESQTDYEETWFRSVLATMQFHAEDALDAPVPSASPSS
jgi:hypothetical protein